MIEKKSASQILNLGESYTTLPNKSLDLITNPITLGVWVFLVSKHKDWDINRENICKRFGISKRSYYNSIAELKHVGLCKEYTKRNEKSLCGKLLVVVSSTNDWDAVQTRLDGFSSESGIRFFEFVQNREKDAQKPIGTVSSPIRALHDSSSSKTNEIVSSPIRALHDSSSSKTNEIVSSPIRALHDSSSSKTNEIVSSPIRALHDSSSSKTNEIVSSPIRALHDSSSSKTNEIVSSPIRALHDSSSSKTNEIVSSPIRGTSRFF